jgi:hypothetical protein
MIKESRNHFTSSEFIPEDIDILATTVGREKLLERSTYFEGSTAVICTNAKYDFFRTGENTTKINLFTSKYMR